MTGVLPSYLHEYLQSTALLSPVLKEEEEQDTTRTLPLNNDDVLCLSWQ